VFLLGYRGRVPETTCRGANAFLFRKIFLSCALLRCLLLYFLAVASVARKQAKALADIRGQRLRSVGSENVWKALIAIRPKRCSELEFTRVVVRKAPKASGGGSRAVLAGTLYF